METAWANYSKDKSSPLDKEEAKKFILDQEENKDAIESHKSDLNYAEKLFET